MFKNINWGDTLKKTGLEVVFAIAYFVIMSIILKFVFLTAGTNVDDGLLHILTTMTILITYFSMMDKRELDKRLDAIDTQLDIIDQTVEDNWNSLDTIIEEGGDMSDLDDKDLEELIEEVKIEQIKRARKA